ncbi:hypothetical protein, partial [Pseudomonas jilinensis]
MTDMDSSTVYGPNAYDSTRIPDQPPQVRRHIGALSERLPWGDTQDILPIGFVGGVAPEALKRDEELEQSQPEYTELLDRQLDSRFNHESFRYAPLQGGTQFWLYMFGLGRGAFYVVTAALLAEFIIFAPFDQEPWSQRLGVTLSLWVWCAGVPAFCWLLGHLVIKFVPERHLLKTSRKGPVWELNRQTGLVTIFARKPGQFRKLGIEGNFVAPFYEFDAAIHTIPDRQGFPQHMLNLVHRYQVAAIDFSVLMGRVYRQEPCVALWDFLQQYMDVSKPLPDIPALEPFRHLDPTTVEHDQRTGRQARYWRDMDEQAF